jgi:hypothetical protein
MPKKARQIRIDGDIAYIPLTRGYEAIIDAADVSLVDGHNWYAHVSKRADGTIWTVYAYRNHRKDGKKTTIQLHRVILNTPDELKGDHRNGDGLDCRRVNLRLATSTENNRNARTPITNTSGAKGVYWNKRDGKWYARIRADGALRHLGLFSDIADAAAAYAQASRKLHGDFGRVE